MEIRPNEVEKIEEIGQLDNHPVRLVKLVGGFWICLGKPKGKTQEEALAAGSHPAIVKYNIEKQFSNFEPMLAKSELMASLEDVVGFTEMLPEKMRKSGYEMYSLSKNLEIEYVLTKYGSQVHVFKGNFSKDSLNIQKSQRPLNSELIGFSTAVGQIAAQDAKKNNKKYVQYDNRKFEAKKLTGK